MENSNEILHKINSGDPELIAEAIKEIQENGDLPIAEALLQQLEQTQDPHQITIIVNLLADIKNNSFRNILIQKIKSTTSPQLKSELLRIVWESSLNYSAYLDLFLDILLRDDFTIALEASTVVENMVYELSPEQLHQLHHFIESFPAEKQFLIENIHEEMGCCD